MTDQRACRSDASADDWAGNWRSLAVMWGLPSAAMIAATFLGPTPRAIIWTVMLLWMGGACLANARRCSRTHCRFTGPFFVIMAAFVVGHGVGILPLGTYGWSMIGGAIVIGTFILWWGSEHMWGTFSR